MFILEIECKKFCAIRMNFPVGDQLQLSVLNYVLKQLNLSTNSFKNIVIS